MGIQDRDYYRQWWRQRQGTKALSGPYDPNQHRHHPEDYSGHQAQPSDLDVVFWLFTLGGIAGLGFIAWLIYRLAKALL